ncbi:hypothetical protein THAOC_24802, partial [Thalassiosira oceanica]
MYPCRAIRICTSQAANNPPAKDNLGPRPISAATIIGVDKRGLSQPKAREQAINKWGDVRIESETGYIEVTGLNTFKLGSDIVTNYGYSTQCKMVYKFFTEKEVAEELQA